jgi:hypothetical protein
MTPLFGILLALACALATNVGFLYKHRGACVIGVALARVQRHRLAGRAAGHLRPFSDAGSRDRLLAGDPGWT